VGASDDERKKFLLGMVIDCNSKQCESITGNWKPMVITEGEC
jgi:hypothetical protein